MLNINKYFYLSFFIFIVIIYLFSTFFLYTTKEHLNFKEIDEIQSNHKFKLYLSGIFQNTHDYKFYNFLSKKPEILILGSSRSMSIRGEFFNTNFYNGGGLVNNFNDLQSILTFIENYNHKYLKEIIIVIDPWWFLENKNYNSLIVSKEYNIKKYNQILKWKTSFTDTIKLLNSIIGKGLKVERLFTNEVNFNYIGFEAIYSNTGFDKFGSYHYDGILKGQIKGDIKFQDALIRNKKDDDPFTKNNKIDFKKLNLFIEKINNLSNANFNYKILFLPFEKTLRSNLESRKKLVYLENIFNYLDNNQVRYFNYTFSDFDSCEYIDSTHIGDVIAARILLDINLKHQIEKLNINLLSNIIEKYTGYASWHANYRGIKEIDFLRINCQKD